MSITGSVSGSTSIIPAQLCASPTPPSPGKVALKLRRIRLAKVRFGAGFSTRIRSNGETASSAQRRGVVQASGKCFGAAGRSAVPNGSCTSPARYFGSARNASGPM